MDLYWMISCDIKMSYFSCLMGRNDHILDLQCQVPGNACQFVTVSSLFLKESILVSLKMLI